MNATNRGIVRGICFSLEKAYDVLIAMYEKETEKEQAYDGGVPIETLFGNNSEKLDSAALFIKSAIGELENLFPKNVDFEDNLP